MGFSGSSFWYFGKLPVAHELLSLNSTKVYIDITTSRSFPLSTFVLFISVIQSVNSAKFLSITCLLSLSACIAAVCAPCAVKVIATIRSMYTSL